MIGFITGLPRTRTRWFAEYFQGLPGVTAYHELLNGLHTKEEFYEAMESGDYVINCDSGLFITDFQERWPEGKTIIIERNIHDVYESLKEFLLEQGYGPPSFDFLYQQAEATDNLKGLRVDYDKIDEKLPLIHNYMGIPYNEVYAQKMKKQNLQIPVLTTDVESYRLWGVI